MNVMLDTLKEGLPQLGLELSDEICQQLDLSRPVIMPRHERDWDSFGLTHFLPESASCSIPTTFSFPPLVSTSRP